jgi:hypothetical protein
MMNLEDFVSEVLVQIVRGTQKAREAVGTAGKIAVDTRSFKDGAVTFDVALVSTDETSAKGGIGVVGVFNIGGQAATGATQTQTSRVQFQLHLDLPPAGRFPQS